MPIKAQLVTGEFYHINLRAVGNDTVFKDADDYWRGIFSIYEFNNAKPVSIWLRRQQRKAEKVLHGPTVQSLDKRDKFVEVLAFCFMPNHVHLLVKQVKENGISSFMQKFGGFAFYLNKKYSRKGHLFNSFKPVHIASDDQLKNVVTYIHTNPIALIGKRDCSRF
jgi:putative transposase